MNNKSQNKYDSVASVQIEADQPTYISDPVNISVFKRLLRTFLLKPLIRVCYDLWLFQIFTFGIGRLQAFT